MSEVDVNGSAEQQDEVLDVFAPDAEKVILSQPETTDVAEEQTTESPAPSEDKIPEKFRGKSLEDIVESYQNLERAYGQRSNDVGELRKTVEELIKQQLGGATSSNDEPEDDDYSADKKARSEISGLKDALLQRERMEQRAGFMSAHPDAEKIVADPRFQTWVNASQTRVRLFKEADANYDFALAGELLTLYKDATKERVVEQETKRDTTVSALKNAKPNTAGGVNPSPKRRVFKSSDLMKLKDRDPDRYERLQPEILKAYNEGRVIRDA